MTQVKICGLADEAGVEAALAGRAHYIGFVFYPKSPRNISLDRARVLAAQARGRAQIVAVTVDADDALLGAIEAAIAPDWLQLHGDESPARAAAVRGHAGRGVIKALALAGSADLAAAQPFDGAADMLMFDAKPPPNADRPGGHGAAFDWKILKDRRFAKPWLLSGGLDAGNVARAISESGARGVDVSSGVERAPGLKDGARIAAFLAAARPL
jgi:phosphoribosylanthranilate isomerase